MGRRTRSSANFWKEPPEPGVAIELSPRPRFVTLFTRFCWIVFSGAALAGIVGLLVGAPTVGWISASFAVPAAVYLALVHAWTWARSSLEKLAYGHVPGEEPSLGTPPEARDPRRQRRRLADVFHARRDKEGSDMALIGRLMKEVRRYWPHMAAVLLIYLVATPIFLLTPIPLKIAVDSVLKNLPLPGFLRNHLPALFTSSSVWLLVMAALLQIIVTLLGQLQGLASNLLSTYAGEKMSLDLRSRMFDHVQRLSLAFHDTRGSADSIYRIQYDAPSIRDITIDGFIPIVASIFTLITAIYVAARIDWQLSLVALTVAPLLFLTSRKFKNDMRPHYTGVKMLESSALGVAQEVFGSIRVVKAFGREEGERSRFADVSRLGVKAKVRLALAEGLFGMVAGTTVALGTAAVLFVGVRHVQTHVISLGELLVVMGYIAQLYSPLKTFTKQMGQLQSSLASAQRAFELLDMEPEVDDRPGAIPLQHAMGEIDFSHVQFSYTEGKPVLKDATFHIDPGMRVGIAGRTGAGKSTLLSLLMRFYDADSGTISLDGRDVQSYKLADVRNQFALVLQEPVLFSTTIADNIRYGRPDASYEDVVEAATAANAHDFISASPNGYDTLAGERGMKLSGGERQRISLARAFLKNASILILDEPTSSVDVHTEAQIMEAMERLMQGRTTLMIAHRLQTLESCDMILFIKDGVLNVAEPDILADLMNDIDLEPTPPIHLDDASPTDLEVRPSR